jgi:hypothetical protein
VVKADELDQRPDLRLRASQQDRASASAKAACKHSQVEHQRRVGEHQVAQVDDDIRLRAECPVDRAAPNPLGGSVLVTRASQRRRLVVEVDDL